MSAFVPPPLPPLGRPPPPTTAAVRRPLCRPRRRRPPVADAGVTMQVGGGAAALYGGGGGPAGGLPAEWAHLFDTGGGGGGEPPDWDDPRAYTRVAVVVEAPSTGGPDAVALGGQLWTRRLTRLYGEAALADAEAAHDMPPAVAAAIAAALRVPVFVEAPLYEVASCRRSSGGRRRAGRGARGGPLPAARGA